MLVYPLFIGFLLLHFSATVYAVPFLDVSDGNLEHTRQLRALAFDLDADASVNKLTNSADLAKLLDKHIFGESFDSQSLSIEQYLRLIKRKDIERLRAIIQHYRSLERYQWPIVVAVELRLGLRTKEVAKIRWILTQLGDIKPSTVAVYRESIFDPSIEAGLKRFQSRHGYLVNGKLDPKTILSLNTKPSIRVTQLQNALKNALNRYDEARDYVSVNLTDYTLRVTNNGIEQIVMPVIVGKPSSKTPVLSTTISVITVNPSWTPPASIIYKDIFQQIEKQPNYLSNNDFVFKIYKSDRIDKDVEEMSLNNLKTKLKSSALVQLPGTKNALGKYRFTIPNSDAIFLHDTPRKHLFKRTNRALSHGCIRLSQPERFAKYLMSKEPAETRFIFEKAVKSGHTKHFRLTSKLPINLNYQSVWIDNEGVLQIRGNNLGIGANDG